MAGSRSLISRVYDDFEGVHFGTPLSSLRTNEVDLVRGLLQILQGSSSSLFYWDEIGKRFCIKSGIHVAHLSFSSLYEVVNQFLYAATCLRLVEVIVNKIELSTRSPPTLRAFGNSVSAWLKRLRDIGLTEEVKINESNCRSVPTLLGMANSLSSLCSGAEFLLQIVDEAIPQVYLESISSIPAAEVAIHVLDHLYMKLHEVCLVQGGEEEAYRMLIYLFVGSLLPYIESLDSWLYEGILHDPFNEMFFYENKAVSINDAEFWEKSYLLRSLSYQKLDGDLSSVTHDANNRSLQLCPLFIRDIDGAIVSAGKSLQLIRHVYVVVASVSTTSNEHELNNISGSASPYDGTDPTILYHGCGIPGLTLSEVFCVSLSGLIGHGDHLFSSFKQYDLNALISHLQMSKFEEELEDGDNSVSLVNSGKTWFEILKETLWERGYASQNEKVSSHVKNENVAPGCINRIQSFRSFCPENPALTVSKMFLNKNKDSWGDLNLSDNFSLPPLDDHVLREAIFITNSTMAFSAKQSDCSHVSGFRQSAFLGTQDDTNVLERLFPFPTILPSFRDDLRLSEHLPFQKNSSLSSRILAWIESVEPKATPLPTVILQECLIFYIKKQVDYIGTHMLSKLMKDWKLMDELGVLRDIYLLGSGDMLQHFLTVVFSKLDKGESCDDDFELNMILQESIRNSADCMLLSAPDSLVVSIVKPHDLDDSDHHNLASRFTAPHRIHDPSRATDGLDTLNFTYKVAWPLELIANAEAIKKYNQVMHFLLKVKHAKFVLDKARRWMWKGRSTVTVNHKHHWLVEQKLLHFVDAFHQYVMDRVYHSAWRELCEGMAAAHSLDEVIYVHETYLLSVQRQCFVAPDKLWALIASRINIILGLALDFYSIQRTMSSGGAISAVKARCEMEVERIEKQFDDCIAFLLRVLSFKLNVGHFPHLADLVTRINYNYYYMSDSGNMIIAPGSEAVKLGKGKHFQ
ncbi:hypothetical protein Dimus_025630 [Dionaea muscipula]